MPKTGLKTFVYSFSVSLFAIFAANGIYWHDHTPKAANIKIPAKNITLFLKNETTNPSNSFAPVKKIALTVLPEIQHQPSTPNEDAIIMADNFDLLEIPLEFSEGFDRAPLKEPPETVLLAENAAPKPKQIRQTAEEIKESDKVVIPLQIPGSADIHRPKKTNKATNNRLVRADDALPFETKRTSLTSVSQTSERDEETSVVVTDASDDLPLLPIEKSETATTHRNNIVRIGDVHNLNQVALADKSIPIKSMETPSHTSTPPLQQKSSPQWEKMSDRKVEANSSPWLVAKADGALKNKRVAKEAYYSQDEAKIKEALNPQAKETKGVKVAAETVKNLLIPIPEDILNDENLTPQLSYPPEGNPQESEKNTPTQQTAENSKKPSISKDETPPTSKQTSTEGKNKLLASLDSIFNSAKTEAPKNQAQDKKNASSSPNKKADTKKQKMGKIMPTEMRLSFQPNRAEISGQTLRWIQAFATKAAESPNMTIEIRIDGTSAMALQQKRLNLLHNILTDKGVEYSKINTIFTQREPNSFIIKTITNHKGANRNLNKAVNGYYQQW